MFIEDGLVLQDMNSLNASISPSHIFNIIEVIEAISGYCVEILFGLLGLLEINSLSVSLLLFKSFFCLIRSASHSLAAASASLSISI